MPLYQERLWPTPWMFIASILIIPATLLVLAPISFVTGLVTGPVLYLGLCGIFLLASPTITVTADHLSAGPAQISLGSLGVATGISGPDAAAARGRRLDARAWLLIRGWVPDVVRVEVTDQADPVPYWLISTRHPEEMAAALNGTRRP